MASTHEAGVLDQIPVSKIQPNPENPRVAFRQGELEELQESIRQFGVQVPIAVFKKAGKYILIDGERRWRCASKLNMRLIPALIQAEPAPLENLLLMFNIHALREQWDLLTIALKLPRIVALLKQENGRAPTEAELSSKTGLARGVIRRCRLLMELPKKYHEMLLAELHKPKSRQTLSEDLFIEMERALTTVSRAMPGLIVDRNRARDALLAKYKSKVIDNIVDFRKVAKIARAERVSADASEARQAIQRLMTDPAYSITRAWSDTVSDAYEERDILSKIDQLLSKLGEMDPRNLDEDIREKLEELAEVTRALLGADA